MELFNIENLKGIIQKLIDNCNYELDSAVDSNIKLKYSVLMNIYKSFYDSLNSETSTNNLIKLRDDFLRNSTNFKNAPKNQKDVTKVKTNIYSSSAYETLSSIIDDFLKSFNLLSTGYSNSIINKMINNKANNKDLYDKETYKLSLNRREILSKLYSNEIISYLNDLESIESQIAIFENEKEKPISLTKGEFVNALKNCITAINDYYFLKYKKSSYYKKNTFYYDSENNELFKNKFNLYYRKFSNLISSLEDDRINTDELISYLSIYNLDNNYEIFKKSMKAKEFDGNKINKQMYEENVAKINEYINSIINRANQKIKGRIEIKDRENDRNDLINKRNDYLKDTLTFINERNDVHAIK